MLTFPLKGTNSTKILLRKIKCRTVLKKKVSKENFHSEPFLTWNFLKVPLFFKRTVLSRTFKTEQRKSSYLTSTLHSSCCLVRTKPFPLPLVLPFHQMKTLVFIWNGRTNLWMCSFPSFAGEAERNRFVLTRSSPRLISTGQLHASRRFHLRPINDVVYIEPYSIKDERSNLRVSFTLRCLQRLSRPYVATQPCPWRDNWCTSGTSIPVLSY